MSFDMFFTISDALFDLLLLFHLLIIPLAIITYTFQRIHGKKLKKVKSSKLSFFSGFFVFLNKAIELELVLLMMVIIVQDLVTPVHIYHQLEY